MLKNITQLLQSQTENGGNLGEREVSLWILSQHYKNVSHSVNAIYKNQQTQADMSVSG